jgi:hypothetical protein
VVEPISHIPLPSVLLSLSFGVFLFFYGKSLLRRGFFARAIVKKLTFEIVLTNAL